MAEPAAPQVAPHVMIVLLALALQPAEEEYAVLPRSPLSEGDVLLFAGFIAILAVVFGFDMIRTWWETTQWKRDARRKRRQTL
jgi:hypothetical protein